VENKINIDKNLLAPEDLENTKLITLDDGSVEEVYISRAGNIVTNPKERSKGGHIKDPRQDIAWEYYVKAWKAGNPSAKAAALFAGYSENSAINMASFKWFKERKNKLRRSNMLTKAERNLSRILDMDYSTMKLIEVGKDDEGKPIMEEREGIDKDVLRVVADVSKTIVTTLGKDDGYSTKTEVDGKMSGDIKINSISYADNQLEIENKVVEEGIKLIEDAVIKEIDENGTTEN